VQTIGAYHQVSRELFAIGPDHAANALTGVPDVVYAKALAHFDTPRPRSIDQSRVHDKPRYRQTAASAAVEFAVLDQMPTPARRSYLHAA
jgi:hypothetical protein